MRICDLSPSLQLLLIAGEVLRSTPSSETETIFRVVVAVGTMCSEHSKVRVAARELGLMTAIQGIYAAGGQVREAAEETERVMRM